MISLRTIFRYDSESLAIIFSCALLSIVFSVFSHRCQLLVPIIAENSRIDLTPAINIGGGFGSLLISFVV